MLPDIPLYFYSLSHMWFKIIIIKKPQTNPKTSYSTFSIFPYAKGRLCLLRWLLQCEKLRGGCLGWQEVGSFLFLLLLAFSCCWTVWWCHSWPVCVWLPATPMWVKVCNLYENIRNCEDHLQNDDFQNEETVKLPRFLWCVNFMWLPHLLGLNQQPLVLSFTLQ